MQGVQTHNVGAVSIFRKWINFFKKKKKAHRNVKRTSTASELCDYNALKRCISSRGGELSLRTNQRRVLGSLNANRDVRTLPALRSVATWFPACSHCSNINHQCDRNTNLSKSPLTSASLTFTTNQKTVKSAWRMRSKCRRAAFISL